MKTVYLLQHSYEYGKDCEHTETKTIGIYRTYKSAEAAAERCMKLPGFREYPKTCFYIDEYELDKDEWPDGFIEITAAQPTK